MNESRVAELRRTKGWTQERLAKESGITVRTIQRLEAGNDASLESISLVARALDVQVGELFQSVQTPNFSQAVEGLESRTRIEQERRDSITQGIMMIFRGVGLLVTFGTVILGTAGGVGWYVWLIIPIYWGAGKVLLDALMRLSLDPKLDAKYPLSVPSRDEDS
ncbi:helix-turn-helix domain-containing protein [Glutamicibacter sp. M10]|uniref:helix-turn-helix domain-containing protein n=1 Tax=Glutamicibacter sp. M10 TaxID=3023076 RepID=UPI0021C8C7C9|nr:helix-turn-helix domain-containing protein [Glutamicibacter sp. M10]UXN32442.1 helix-turn-helix domain-containing protein [Glutamicibacter sp. M10]